MRERWDRVHEGDALELLKELPSGCSTLVIADPPYNLGPAFGTKFHRNLEQWLPWCKQWLEESTRVLDDRGNIFVYGIHHYLCYLQVHMYELGLQYRRQIIWHYENGWAGYSKSLAAHYEPILWFSKTDDYVFHPIREPYKSTERLKHPVTKNGKVWTPHPDGRLAGDVWRFPTLAGRRFRDEKVDHPTQKPLSLTRRIVEHFSDPGDLVVVPFAGSGTECVAAVEKGRHFWGAEINSDYVSIAHQRIAEVDRERESRIQIDSSQEIENPQLAL
jgi:site-specific DNA-methyltransferase (adenine-specific)